MAMNEAEKARISNRKSFVRDKMASKGIDAKTARRRFYVQTRVKELQAKGVTVDAEKRKQLQRKFDSGNVARKGFGQPKKRVSTSGSSSVSSPPSTSGSKPVDKGRSATSNMKGVSGYKAGSTKSSSISTDSKKGRSGKGKVYDFARNELLGVDDFGRAGKNLRKGNYGKAAKSAGAGVLELGSTALSIFGIGAGAKAAVTGAKAAKAAKAAKGASNLKYYKNLGKSAPKIVGKSAPYKAAPLSKSAKAANFKYYKNIGKPATKTVSKATKKVAPTAAKRSPRVAKTVSKPLAKSTSKSLTSKAVSKTVVKKVPKKRIK